MNWYLEVLKKYVEFTGRARRTEYWMFTLVNIIFTFVLLGLMTATGSHFLAILFALYVLAMLPPHIAVAIRRLHDTGTSGWWFLIVFVPGVGIILLVFMVLDGDPGENQYGPSPK